MCGRLNVTADPLTQLLMDAFGITAEPRTNHNLAPTEDLLVVRPALDEKKGYRADELRWWLTPSWSNGPSTRYAMFNAKSETLSEKRSFAKPFRSQRCVVPVSGYYEWKRGERTKLPFHISTAETGNHMGGLLLAGLWDSYFDSSTNATLESCAIVTAAAHEDLAYVHHRQPVFLSTAEAHRWLDHSLEVADLGELMTPHLPTPLQVDPVSTHVNNARNKDSRCMQPVANGVQLTNAGQSQDLFDLD